MSEAIPARLIGPAEVDARVNTFDEATEDSISVSWNEVAGAKGYLIRRVMYSDNTAMTSVAEKSNVTYYYDTVSGEITLEDGGNVAGRATVSYTETGFAITDNYMESDTNDNDLKLYQNAQAKISWGLPFRYVVLPVLEKDDFDFIREFECEGKVKYEKLSPSAATATFGYGQKVHAKKLESATNQEVSWKEPFYGKNLTPKVYKRIFTPKDDVDASWKTVDAIIKDNAINYTLFGDERYCAWEYVVKYVNNSNSNTIAPSYLDWLNAIENTDNDETDYDYGEKNKEKLNKGYVLAMEYSANYGGEGTSKNDADYYSESVKITPWDYADRGLGPDKVELKILCLDLADGWQTVGALDPEIKGFTEKNELTDTTVEYENINKLVKLKPTEISKNKNGKGTTSGPLKILRSAKHYYGLNLYHDRNEEFDCKNYETYAYRQITDEELIKSTMLVVAEVIRDARIEEWGTGTIDKVPLAGKASVPVNGTQGSFDWSQSSGSAFWWTFANFVNRWNSFPNSEYTKVMGNNAGIPHFIILDDNSTRAKGDERGYKYGSTLYYLCYKKSDSSDFSISSPIPINISSEVSLDSYKGKVYFAVCSNSYNYGILKKMSSAFYAYVSRENSYDVDFTFTDEEEIKKWFPGKMNNNGYNGDNFAYGWWDN